MKTNRFIFYCLLVWTFMIQSAVAQNVSGAHRDAANVRKMKRYEKMHQSRMRYQKLLESKHYVFQADHLKMSNGESIALSTDVNFFAVRGDTAVLQFVFRDLSRVSSNGLGGITAKGFAERYRLRAAHAKKAMLVTTYIHPRGSSGSAYVVLSVGNHGYGQLDVTVNGAQFSLSGQLSPPDKAKIFEGHTLFR
jgi:hypothetical protein